MFRCTLAIMATLALASCAFAKEHTYRRTEEQMKDLLQRIQHRSERFRISIANELEKRGVNVATPQDNIYHYVSKLTQVTSRLADIYGDGQTGSANAQQALRWSAAIDGYLWRHHLTPQIEDDWHLLRTDLKELADAYHVPWGWLGPIGHAHRRSEIEMKALVDQMETRADSFRKSLDNALDKTRFNSTSAEDNVNQLVEDFEHATDRLKDEFADSNAAPAAVHEVLSKAARIDTFMRQHRLTPTAQVDWRSLRDEIDRLADAYHTSWAWT